MDRPDKEGGKVRVYIGLGANLGDPLSSMEKALAMIEQKGLGRVLQISRYYRTEPVGMKDQPWFVNAAALIETDLAPGSFHAGLKQIESELGRPDRRIKDGPRVIDLDILLWGEEKIETEQLVVPHPRMASRRFVLGPLAEIAPEAGKKVLGKSAAELLEKLEDPARAEPMDG